MKLTTLLMTLALLTASAAGYSQITLKEKNVPLEKALSDIEKQTKYVFLYDAGDLKSAPVTIDVTNVTLEEALKQCLAGLNIEFTVEDNNVLLRSKPPAAVPPTVKKATGLIDVHGRVVDENGLPLPAATVQIKNGKQQVTITDEKGFFTLTGVESNAILVVTMIGYEKKELPVAANLGDIPLKIASSQLDAVQVIAYGTTTERLNTGDVSSVSAKKIEEQPVNSPLLALEGQVPGLFISQSNGLPGSTVNVQIRGLNSFTSGNSPLYIIDGIPYGGQTPMFFAGTANVLNYTGGINSTSKTNPFDFINPADIESIDILKDAAATAIYGSRGANGVILINTKKGKPGEMKIDLNIRDGFGQVSDKMKLLNTPQYLEMRHEAFKNDGTSPNPDGDYDLTLWDTTRYTDWQKVLIGGKAQYTDVNLTISGGNANTQYLIGSGYHRETGVSPGATDDRKGSLNFNINSASPNQKFKISLSGNYSVNDNGLSSNDFTEMALSLPPDAPPLYNSDGTINWEPNAAGYSTWPQYYGYRSPASNFLQNYNVTTYNVLLGNTISYEILSGLLIKCDMGASYDQVSQFSDYLVSLDDPAVRSINQSFSNFGNDNTQSWIAEPQLTYRRSLAKGVLNVLTGLEINQIKSADQVLHAEGFSSDLLVHDIAAATTILPTATNSIYKYNAIFGRIDYNWQDKYILNLTARRDGSSRFGPANRFHNFWDIGGAWIFSEENWVRNNLSWLSLGKFRGSYGTTGNDQIGDYSYLDLYQPTNQSTTIGVPYQGSGGLTPIQLYTPNLQWELTKKLEAGIDLGFLKDRVLLNMSYYRNRSSNELLPYQLPSITGFTIITKNLDALVQNKGIEWTLSTINIKTNKFRWSSSINLSINRNMVLSAGDGAGAYYQRLVGHSLAGQFVYHFMGVNPITGVAEFEDSKGGQTTTPNPATDENTYIDGQPQFYGGLQNSLSYKIIQLNFNFQFVKKQGPVFLFNYLPGTFNNASNQPVTVLTRWQQPGDVTNIERFSENGSLTQPAQDELFSDLSYGDASFIRLKNVSLSVTLPQTAVKKMGLRQARVFIQGQNLMTFTKYKGLDPETPFNDTVYPNLPPLRVFTIGIQATF